MKLKLSRKKDSGQSVLDLDLEVERDPRLLEMYGIDGLNSGYVDNNFGFNRIRPLAPLSLTTLQFDAGYTSITGCRAHEIIEGIKSSTATTPLCLWAIDQMFGWSPDRIREVLELKPNEEKGLMILTYGVFGVGKNEDNRRYIYLRETPDGFKVEVVTHNNSIILYTRPTYDLCALCVPNDSCFSSLTG